MRIVKPVAVAPDRLDVIDPSLVSDEEIAPNQLPIVQHDIGIHGIDEAANTRSYDMGMMMARNYAKSDKALYVGTDDVTSFDEWSKDVPVNWNPEEEQPSWIDAGKAAFSVENSLVSGIQNQSYDWLTVKDGYIAENDPAVQGYGDIKHLWGVSTNPENTQAIINNYNREKEARDVIMRASTPKQLLTMMLAATTDPYLAPLWFIPPARGAKTADQMQKWAAAGIAAEGAAELAKHESQMLRTTDESFNNIAMAGLMMGAFGGASAYMGGRSGQAKLSKDSIDYVDGKTYQKPVEPVKPLGSVGAAENVSQATLDDYGLAPAAGLEMITGTPMGRSSNSPILEVRETAYNLADSPYFHKGHMEGKTLGKEGGSIEARVRIKEGEYAKLKTETDELFFDYRDLAVTAANKVKMASEIMPMLNKSDGLMTKIEFKEAVSEAVNRGGQSDIPQVKLAAEKTIAYFDDYKKQLVEAKLLPEEFLEKETANYLHRMWNRENVLANKSELIKIITDHYGDTLSKVQQRTFARTRDMDELQLQRSQLDEAAPELKKLDDDIAALQKRIDSEEAFSNFGRADLEAMARETIDNIMGTPLGNTPFNVLPEGVVLKAGALKQRMLDIPYDKIKPFLEQDVDAITRGYMRTMAPQIEIAKDYGDAAMTRWIKDFERAYDVEIDTVVEGMKEAGKSQKAIDKAVKKLESQRITNRKDIIVMRDRLLGTAKQPTDPMDMAWRAGHFIKQLNFTRFLGGMTPSAFPDIARPVMVHGLGNTVRAMRTIVASPDIRKMSIADARRTGTVIEAVMNSRNHKIAELTDTMLYSTKLERGMGAISDNFGKVSLMTYWNDALKGISAMVTQDVFLRGMAAKGAGTANKKQIRDLAKAGISDEMAERIMKEFDVHGLKDDGTWIANVDKWTDDLAKQSYKSAINKTVDEVIVTPSVGDMPRMFDGNTASMLLQFKSFAFSSHQKVLVSGLQAHDMAYAQGLMMAITLGGMVFSLKEVEKGRDPSRLSDEEFLAEALDRSGALGWLNEANNLAARFSGGKINYNRAFGIDSELSRYEVRGIIGSLAGPTGGLLADVAGVGSAVSKGEWEDADSNKARRVIPMQNLIYWNWLLNRIN